MDGKVRRVVTGHDANGKAVVLEDGPAPNVRLNPHRPGHISTELWKTQPTPVIVKSREPDPTAGPKVQIPPSNGTVFRISELPPETEGIHSIDAAQAKEIFKFMGNERGSTFGQTQRHPFMHRTETVDYAVVLEGEVFLMLDEEEVHLKAGDVVIQRGTNHAWSNRSGKPVKMLYVLIDGKFDPELEKHFGGR